MSLRFVTVLFILIILASGCAERFVEPAEPPFVVQPTAQNETVAQPEPQALPAHECALITQEDAAKLCGLPIFAAALTQVDWHDTKSVCKSELAQDKLPYSKVIIEETKYFGEENATRMFERDIKMMHGEPWKFNMSFITTPEIRLAANVSNQSATDKSIITEFVLADRRVQITDVDAACFSIEKLTELVRERLLERLAK
jgi:hypothetical protein